MQLLSGQNLKNGKREEDEERVCVGKGGGGYKWWEGKEKGLLEVACVAGLVNLINEKPSLCCWQVENAFSWLCIYLGLK